MQWLQSDGLKLLRQALSIPMPTSLPAATPHTLRMTHTAGIGTQNGGIVSG